MAKVSQRSIAELMRFAQRLGIYDPMWSSDRPVVTRTEMRRFLYARDLPEPILSAFDKWEWEFDDILPAISSNSFSPSIPLFSRGGGRTHTSLPQGEELILEIASAFLLKAAYINNHSVYGAIVSFTELMDSLDRDGFAMVGENLRARDEVIDIDQEMSRFEQTLQEGPHDRKNVVQHHLQQAELHHAKNEWGAAASEWRHVFEESLRGAWRVTRVENVAFASRIEKPSFRDVLLWLEQADFLQTEEREAFGAAFGFLSIGNHPGIKDEHVAHLSRALALPLAYACLLKLSTWDGVKFRER